MPYAVVTDGLVANWDVQNYTNGTIWRDSVGNRAITFTGSPQTSSDGIELNSSITFASESISSLGITTPMSIEWIGRIDSQSFSNSSPGNVFSIGESLGSWDNSITCYSKLSPNGIQLDIDNSGTVITGMTSSGLYHMIITVDNSGDYFSNNKLKLYINGSLIETYFDQWYSPNQSLEANKNYIYNNEGIGRFVGAVSAIRLWNKALSESEVQTAFTEIESPKYSYIKIDGVYTRASKSYQKKNGIWVETDPSELHDPNTKYVLKR